MSIEINDIVPDDWGISNQKRFGIEIEVERVYDPPVDEIDETHWSFCSDGSLRNGGLEFLSPRPWSPSRATTSIGQFYAMFAANDWQGGVRCSTHVHCNMHGKTAEQVAAIATLHLLVEPILFRYCGAIREENIYCVPWYRTPNEVDLLAPLARATTRSALLCILGMSCKYSSLHLEPLKRQGTIEFRHAPVFPTAGEMLTWLDLVDRVAYPAPGFQTPEDVVDTFKRVGAEQFVLMVFGEQLTRVLCGYVDDFHELLEFYDVLTLAEQSCYTYNTNTLVRPTWLRPEFELPGAPPRYDAPRESAWDEPDMIIEDEYYDEEDE